MEQNERFLKGLRRLRDELDDDCISCGEGVKQNPFGKPECSKSLRKCGHHCNHYYMWTHDQCDWCSVKYVGDDIYSKQV